MSRVSLSGGGVTDHEEVECILVRWQHLRFKQANGIPLVRTYEPPCNQPLPLQEVCIHLQQNKAIPCDCISIQTTFDGVDFNYPIWEKLYSTKALLIGNEKMQQTIDSIVELIIYYNIILTC